MSLIVVLDLSVDPAQREGFVQMVGEMLSVTRSAEGCQGVEVGTDMDDGGRVLLMERWETRANHEAYLGARAEDGSSAKMGKMLTAAPTITYTEPQAV